MVTLRIISRYSSLVPASQILYQETSQFKYYQRPRLYSARTTARPSPATSSEHQFSILLAIKVSSACQLYGTTRCLLCKSVWQSEDVQTFSLSTGLAPYGDLLNTQSVSLDTFQMTNHAQYKTEASKWRLVTAIFVSRYCKSQVCFQLSEASAYCI